MAKIVAGAAMIAGAVTLEVVAPGNPLSMKLGMMGVSLTASGIADELRGGPGNSFSTKQPAGARQIVYGQTRVSGTIIFESTTGHQLNQVIAWASHPCASIDDIYLDGRECWALHGVQGGGVYGDTDDGYDHYDSAGNKYNFKKKVYMQSTLGSYSGQWLGGVNAQNPGYWGTDCTLNGICATYVKATYDADLFGSVPGIKAAIHGKNDIYDPRTGTRGYTENAALCIADVLCNKEFGVGCDYATEIDEDQLIAAANICDEQVALAGGGYEPRYTVNGFFPTSTTPGDILDSMLMSCEGRISYSGGRWKIYPAAWYGTTLAFDQNDLAGPVKWTPKRKYRDLANAVRATYVCPSYPYTQTGYDRNHKNTGIWDGEYQPTDAPEYAQDVLHGYPSDLNLAADGQKLYTERKYQFVTSCATVQRLMKIYLLRNRQQGYGTLQTKLTAFQTQAQDVIKMSFPTLGWSNKNLEVLNFHFVPKMEANNPDSAPTIMCELDVVETDPSVYTWSTAEERGIEDTPSPVLADSLQVQPPTNLQLESGNDSAVINADGIVTPRIHASWTEPDDPFVTTGGTIEIQLQPVSSSTWTTAAIVSGTTNEYYIAGVVSGQQYNVRIRAIRASGASSYWVEVLNHTVSCDASSISLDNITDGQDSKKTYAKTGIFRFKVRAWGNSCQSSQKQDGIWVDGVKKNPGSTRSYNLMVWDRNTMQISPTTVWGRASGTHEWGDGVTCGGAPFIRSYDVYADANQASLLAQDLGTADNPNPNLTSGYIAIVWTMDEPKTNHLTNNLPAAIYWCGGTAQFSSSGFKSRSAYALMGIPGIGQGNGLEMYRGSTDNDYNAWVELGATVIDGDIQGIQSSVTTALGADVIQYSDGTTVDSLKPAAAGADVTANNVSYDSARLNGVGSGTIVGTSGWLNSLGRLTTGTPNKTIVQMEDGVTKAVLGLDANGDLARDIISSRKVVGRTESLSVTLGKLNSSGLLLDADQIAADGATYKKVNANQRTGGDRGYAALDSLNKLTTGTPNRTTSQIEGVIGSDGRAKQVDLASIANGNLDNIGEGVTFKRITADEKRGQSISYDVAALSSSLYSGTVISDATARSGQCLYKTTASSVLWGPYYNGSQVPNGDCMVIFRMKVDSNAGSTNLVYLDATTGGGATTLSGRWLTPSSFETSGNWQDFGLRVRLDANMSSIEFRAVNYSGAVPIYLDTVRVVPVSVDMDVVRDTGNYARTTVTARDTFIRGTVPTTGNLLLNAGFENGLAYWRSDGGVVVVTDPSVAHSGSQYVQVPTASGGYGLCQTDDRNDIAYPRKIRVRPNEQYYQEVWVYLEGSAGQAGAYCDIYDVNGGYITTVMSNMISIYGQWVKSSQTFTIPSNGAYIIVNAATALGTNGVTRVDDALLARLTDNASLANLSVTADKRGAGCINQDVVENRLYNAILQGASDWTGQPAPPSGFNAWVAQGVNVSTPAPTLLGTGEAQCYPGASWADCWSTAYQIIPYYMLGLPGESFCMSVQAKWSSSTQPNGNFYMLIMPQSSLSDTGFGTWNGVEYYIPAAQLSQDYSTCVLAGQLPGCSGGTATSHYRIYFGLRWGTVGGYKWRRPQISRSVDPPRWIPTLNTAPVCPTSYTPVGTGGAGGDPAPRSGGGSGTQNNANSTG